MWPERGEALDRTIEVEAAVADLYAEALRRWAPFARSAVMPALTADAAPQQPPPDTAAVAQAQSDWNAIADTVVVAGIAMLWAMAYVDAAKALGVDLQLPDVAPADVPDFDRKAASIVARTTDATPKQVRQYAAQVQASTVKQNVADFLDSQRQLAAGVPGRVQAKVTAAVADATPEPGADALAAQRDAAAAALEPGSLELRDVARDEGYQAAGVLNHAIIEAAAQSDEDLDKVWIATLDGKTRPTHWAADGQRAPLNGSFAIGGEQMAYPGDETASPAEWKNCRCRVGVLGKDEAIPDEVDRHTERLDGRDSVAINRGGRTQAEEIERRVDEGNIRARDDPDGIGRVASAAPSEQETDVSKLDITKTVSGVTPADVATKQAARFAAAPADAGTDVAETFLTFTDAVFAVIGSPTSDGRMFAPDCEITWRELPLPLQWCEEMEGGHYGSTTVGVIEKLAIKDGKLLGSGFVLNNDEAVKAAEVIAHGVSNPSVDLGDYEYAGTYLDGTVVTEDNFDADLPIYFTFTKAEIVATTLVAIPAFGETNIVLNADRETREPTLVASMLASLTASGEQYKPRVYDPKLFANPKLAGPTRLTITEDGHIFGHIACFGECHRSIQSECILAPRSKSGYAHFHTSPAVKLSDGTQLPVGRLTVGTGHAHENLAAGPAKAHYDNTGSCFAIGRVGEDKHGVYFSGVAAPWATSGQIEQGLSSALSGDWRRLDGNLELVAALAVNTPGFLARGVADKGGATSLVASLAPSGDAQGAGGVAHLTKADIKAAVAEVLEESARNADLAARREAALTQAHEAVGDPPRELTPSERIAELLEHV